MGTTTRTDAEAAAEICRRYLYKPTGRQRVIACLVRAVLTVQHNTPSLPRSACPYVTRAACELARRTQDHTSECKHVHFVPLLFAHTDASLGYCGYLSACHRQSTCRYLHFAEDGQSSSPAPGAGAADLLKSVGLDAWLHTARWDGLSRVRMPAQWINCDVRALDMSSLGQFDVIVADPPWDIHMSLPYGTLSDDDMRALRLPALQKEGLLFLWVTGRAMELGRELLSLWGYMRVDELIWLKTNQLDRLIRTGRTGHWLNHAKEHCLVGLRSAKLPARREDMAPLTHYLPWLLSGLSTEVIVAQVRDTSRKPSELYDMIEHMCPGGRKLELFGRSHNVRPGWLTLGNQLKSTHVVEPVLERAVAQARATHALLADDPT